MAGTRCSPACSTALKPHAVWSRERRLRHQSERLWPPFPAPQAPPPLSLQLLLELVEKAPVGALGDDLLRAAFDHPRLMEAQGVEADRILRIVLPPAVVPDILHGLEGVRIGPRVAPVHQELGHPLRLEAADGGCLQERAQGPL